MRHLIIIVLAVIIAVLVRIKERHREKLLIVGLVLFSLICGFYSFRHSESILKTIKPVHQTFYTPDFIETNEFPDAFLRLYLKDKTVYVKNDYFNFEEADQYGVDWTYGFYHGHNALFYLRSVFANAVEDPEMNEYVIPENIRGDFESLGFLNDMLRNTMMYSDYDYLVGNYFFYLMYYRDLAATSNIYVNADSIKDSDELVLIWQQKDGENLETEDMYLMGKEYYENKIKNINY